MPRALLAALAVAVLLTACGDADPQQLLEEAPVALEEAGTSRFEMRVTAAGDGVDSDFVATGEQDLTAGTLRMETDAGGLTATATETLVVDEVVYLRSSLFELFTDDPSSWVAVDLAEAGRTAGLDIDTLVEGNTGPAALVQQLHGAAGDIEELGEEEIRGADTRHLRVEVHADRAIEQAPEAQREQLRAFAETSGLPEVYPMEVWVDGDGLVRRVSTVVDVEDETAGTVTQETVLELYDFGVPVDIAAPDDDEVVDMQRLLEDLSALEEGLDAGGGLGLDGTGPAGDGGGAPDGG